MNKFDSLQSVEEWITRDEEEVHYYRPTTFPPARLINAQRSGNNVEVSVLGRQRTMGPLTKELKNIRHDIVLDVLAGGGDVPLNTIGLTGFEGKLTPDFISKSAKSVLEVATTAISETYSLDFEWERKVKKYLHLLKPLNFQLLILVVSPTMLKSNFELTSFEVSMLCYRVRLGLAMESMINEVMGQNMFSEDLTEKENMVEYVMSRMPLTAESSQLFDMTEIMNTTTPVNVTDKAIFKNALHNTLLESAQSSTETELNVRQYMSRFREDNCNHHTKRIATIPFVYSTRPCLHSKTLDPETSIDMPSHLREIWQTAKGVDVEITKFQDAIKEATGEIEWEKHRIQKHSAFNVNLSQQNYIECAKSGVFGKEYESDPEVVTHRKESQKSIHPDCCVSDIEEFCNWNSLAHQKSNLPLSIQLLIKSSKELWSSKGLGLKMFGSIINTKLICFAQTISHLMSEIAYCYRYWPKRSDFYHKESNGIHMLVRSTGTHIFVSYAFPECCAEMVDTGRLGPELFYSDSYIFTDFCSYDEPTLEHFVKSGPYMTAILAHLLTHFELSPEKNSLKSERLIKTINLIYLLYLNNKTDAEELVTSQRYLVMGVLEELDPNPYRFTSRLPEVLRSRLTAYLLKKTLHLMAHYGSSRVKKTIDSRYGKPEISHLGLISLFSDTEISLRQQVNEFYFGYVISKERGRGADRNFKIIKKIIKEEYEARETVKRTLDRSLSKKKFVSNPIVIKVMMSLFKSHLADLYGPEWRAVLKRQILRQLAGNTFTELATLKVASRSYKDRIIMPGFLPGASVKDIRDQLSKLNPEETQKRPKVMEALNELVAHYILENKGVTPGHIVELLPFSFNLLEKKGYFDTDLFIKPQHGGDREIHVLEIAARICQYHIEGISRALARQIPEDSLTHPKAKDHFVSQHHRKTEESLGAQYFTLGKSADATKWCQRNHVSKFACFLMPVVDKLFWNFILSILCLWLYKRMSFPIQFAANLMANQTVESDPLYKRFQADFLRGEVLFSEPKNNKMHIMFGMMQGILHFTSTWTHVIIMVVMAKVVKSYLKTKKHISCVTSVISGSDDSGQLLSLPGRATIQNLQLATTMLHWKDKMAEYASIYTNRAKSSVGTLDLIEFNSEWNIREHSIKPTFRWVSASLETTVVERFIDRIRTMYNTLGQVLEGGGKTLECSIIQMCQAWLHYMMLGLHNNVLANETAKKIWFTKDPSLGYFPLDSDFTAGIVGVDFQLFHLVVTTGFSKVGHRVSDPELLQDSEIRDSSIPEDLRSSRLSFGSLKFWHSLLRRMQVPQLENIIQAVENNPLILFENQPHWDHCKYQIFLKVFQPGVKEALSGYSPTIRMMAATSYLISKQCFSKFVRHTNTTVKQSLFQLLEAEIDQMTHRTVTTEELLKTFPYSEEYKETLEYIKNLEHKHFIRSVPLKTSSKQKLLVFEKRIDEIPVIDMCRRKWDFTHSVPLSSRQFIESWKELKVKYPFLRDTLRETCGALDMNIVEAKNYLESYTIKSRSIVLMDSAAKSSNLKSAISRVFWPDVKIEMPLQEQEIDSFELRSDIFCVLSFWGSQQWKKDYVDRILMHHKLEEKQSVPQRIAKLQTIARWRSGKSKASIVSSLRLANQGLLGFFLKAQEGFGKNRSGDGLWAGTCLGVSINVCMSMRLGDKGKKENICTEIVLDRLAEPKLLGKILRNLVSEFKLVKPKHFQKAQFWLSNSGKLLPGEGESDDIPVRIQNDLKVDFVDRLSEMEWDWMVTDSKIRLIAAVDEDTKITILSDDFSTRDWDPTAEGLLSGPVKSWAQSNAINLTELHDEIISATGVTNTQVLKASKDHTLLTRSGWSVQSLIKQLKHFYVPEMEVALSDDESVLSDDIQELLDFINLEQELSSDDGSSIYDTDSEDNQGGVSLDLDLYDLSNVQESDLMIQEEIFDALPLERFGPKSNIWGMPKFNNFFNGLDTLARVLYKRSFQELASEQPRPITGLLGIILTLITRKPWCSIGRGDYMGEVSQFEMSVTSITQSLATDADYKGLNEKDIITMINSLEEKMVYESELLRPIFRQQITRLSRALMYRHRQTEPDSLTKKSMAEFLDLALQCIPDFPRLDTVNAMDQHLRTAFLRSSLQIDLGKQEKEGAITPHEMSLFVEAINQPIVTTLSMDAVWRGWNIGSRANGYKVGDGKIEL